MGDIGSVDDRRHDEDDARPDLEEADVLPQPAEDAEAAIEKVLASFPQMMFLSNLIYCIIFGLILNLFVSKSLTSNPFEENKTENDD